MEYWQWVQVVLNGSGNIYLIDADYAITFHVHRLRALAMRRWSESRIIAQKQWTIAYCTELTNAFLARSVELVSSVVSNETGKLRRDIASTLLGI